MHMEKLKPETIEKIDSLMNTKILDSVSSEILLNLNQKEEIKVIFGIIEDTIKYNIVSLFRSCGEGFTKGIRRRCTIKGFVEINNSSFSIIMEDFNFLIKDLALSQSVKDSLKKLITDSNILYLKKTEEIFKIEYETSIYKYVIKSGKRRKLFGI